ncbi:glycoside hydrolase family 15 protein [Roseococcus sp. MDT2-1-1]|uniref:Glycoside hydrolase family 15 protein n=2 Tax=Sabulicella glaciei TaxID=2984948 RepID=A0ABT3NTY8_9PROT|nr:glycoside hydrolase family 15 protein [Roseococcus sp. MDT2-1-1]MCW8085626.1 glycoside hydrolase family 15 protein [Roseococcus sp. MDT2-1-1]
MTRPLDLAVIGNCAVSSLVSPTGRHLWFCYPRFDAEPVLNALLGGEDPERGFFDVTLRGQAASRQAYLPNSAVLETVLTDDAGASLRILDLAPRFKRYGRIYRPPSLLRRIEPVAGRPRIRIRLRPTFEYGQRIPVVSNGSNHIRYVSADQVLRLTTDAPLSHILYETEFGLDRPVNLVLGPDETLPESAEQHARTCLSETIAYWADWVRGLNVPFDWQEAVIRAAITLKLCSFEDTGAIVAALTTSVPEAPGSSRNWDYRFCWLRDAFFTVSALNRLNATLTMEGFVRFVLDSVLQDLEGPVPPLFAIAPGLGTEERIAQALPGFLGNGPVRVGNAAVSQRQNDGYGSIILTASQMFFDTRLPRRGDADLYRQLAVIGRDAARSAFEPDAGLWEYRERESVHTYSTAMCWAAVDRLAGIARRVGLSEDAKGWEVQAAGIRERLLREAVVPEEGWVASALGGRSVDASSLLLPEIGLLRANDPLFLRTLEITERRLVRDGFVKRYDEADDFGLPETAFIVCSFWYIDALARVGRREEARAVFETALSWRNHVGLLAEDVDPRTGLLWGNFPQTYSQVGLILSAMRLSRSWEEGLWRG